MSNASSTKEVLVAARWILENVGWCQGKFSLWEGGKPVGFCPVGAVNRVELDLLPAAGLKAGALGLLEDAMISLAKKKTTVYQWNDDRKRTREQVLKAFDKAIKACP